MSNFIHQRVIEKKTNQKTIYNKHQNTIDMQDYLEVTRNWEFKNYRLQFVTLKTRLLYFQWGSDPRNPPVYASNVRRSLQYQKSARTETVAAPEWILSVATVHVVPTMLTRIQLAYSYNHCTNSCIIAVPSLLPVRMELIAAKTI